MTRSGSEPASNLKRLEDRVQQDVERLEKADRERHTLLAGTVYLGTLGVMFVVPVVGGAYLGRWLDSHAAGYSLQWTLSLILTGILVGVVTVYLFIRR